MPQSLDSHNPKLAFSNSEQLPGGVSVQTINFKNASPPFAATCFHVMPGQMTPLDEHAVEETWIVIRGMGRLHYEGKSYPVESGDIFYFPSYKTHQVENSSDNVLMICSIYW